MTVAVRDVHCSVTICIIWKIELRELPGYSISA